MTDWKITSITPIRGEEVCIDGIYPTIYYRYSADNWRVLIGESEESIYDDDIVLKLETLYREFRARSSAGEQADHTRQVGGSNPPAPTNKAT